MVTNTPLSPDVFITLTLAGAATAGPAKITLGPK